MGTRGMLGFHINGQDVAQYVHYDAYPEELGKKIVEDVASAIATMGLDGLKKRLLELETLTQDAKPTPEQMKRLEPYADLSVSTGSLTDPYCLTRRCQGSLSTTIEANAMLAHDIDFMKQSLHCEWAYFVNIDAGTFEVYKGFQRKPHQLGRFADETQRSGYYPCALVAEFPLGDIPGDWIKRVDPEE